MINRRDILIGAACLGGAGAAFALTPRKKLTLLAGGALEDAIPRTLPGWTSRDVSDLVQPKEEGSLMARLYNQTVGRVYSQTDTGLELMLLAAYGKTQSNDLMLHRPETCYPAAGFRISSNVEANLPIPGGGVLPARRLVADAPGRREAIFYWSRLGESLPVSNREQRVDRVRQAMAGYVSDGLLRRISGLGGEPEKVFAQLDRFVPVLLQATPRQSRPALVGTQLAKSLA
jgi:EpsI family protein